MPKIRDFLHKKDTIADAQAYDPDAPQIPTVVRSDSNSCEVINPPTFRTTIESAEGPAEARQSASRFSIFKPRSRNNSSASPASPVTPISSDRPSPEQSPKRGSFLQFRKERASSRVPENLPDIEAITLADCAKEGGIEERMVEKEAQWEERATKLAQQNEKELESTHWTPAGAALAHAGSALSRGLPSSDIPALSVSSPVADDNIQEAIRLHEAGDLQRSTAMLGRLADPQGDNNALSQVLYGLALRWVTFFLFTALRFMNRKLYAKSYFILRMVEMAVLGTRFFVDSANSRLLKKLLNYWFHAPSYSIQAPLDGA